MCDHLMSTRISIVLMHQSFIRALTILRSLDLDLLTILYQSRVSYPRRSGLVGKSNHSSQMGLEWLQFPTSPLLLGEETHNQYEMAILLAFLIILGAPMNTQFFIKVKILVLILKQKMDYVQVLNHNMLNYILRSYDRIACQDPPIDHDELLTMILQQFFGLHFHYSTFSYTDLT